MLSQYLASSPTQLSTDGLDRALVAFTVPRPNGLLLVVLLDQLVLVDPRLRHGLPHHQFAQNCQEQQERTEVLKSSSRHYLI